MRDAREYAAHETLRNGMPVTIRAARRDDRERIAQAFAELDRESVYTRYFTYKATLSDHELDLLDTMDFVRDVMIVVTTEVAAREIVIAAARYIVEDLPGGTPSAEIAFTVEEDYQGNGIAGRLLAHLARIALDNGIGRFHADVLAENRAMLSVFKKSGFAMTERREGGVAHVTLALLPRD